MSEQIMSGHIVNMSGHSMQRLFEESQKGDYPCSRFGDAVLAGYEGDAEGNAPDS